MSTFFRQLQALTPTDPGPRTWLYVPYDQLSDGIGPLAHHPPETLGIVLVECPAKAARRPYHQQKLALLLTNMRHFALEQAQRGVAVRYVVHDTGYAEALRAVVADVGPLLIQRPAERELRHELAPLIASGALLEHPHEGWLTTAEDFEACGDAPWRMDVFYRALRRRTGWLMTQDGTPEGGRYSLDGENRQTWKGVPAAPSVPTFPPDAITAEVVDLVRTRFGDHPGVCTPDQLPATRADAERLWTWAKEHCLPAFGPYEDAMSATERTLFHTRVSPLVNLHRLLPARMVDDLLALDLPLNSREGFLRQVLGWREFMRHVHDATDGFRQLPNGPVSLDESGHACPSALNSHQPLPAAWWGTPSGLHCLDTVVAQLWEDGWTHHITRLMVLSNLATLLDVEPRELTDWFWVAYVDAYDWVVEPNVLGMGTFGVGELFTTKPYVSGSAYIDRMGDYCADCAFHPKKTCPITRLYWAFLDRHRAQLEGNHRLSMPMRNVAKRSPEQRAKDAATYQWVQQTLAQKAVLRPEDAP